MNKIDQMADELGEAFVAPPPERSPRTQKSMPWQPRLGPIGTQILLNRTDETKFAYGERGSLKTGIFMHDIIAHCYKDFKPGMMTPLAVICTIVRGSATEGGAWEKINSLYLPEWFDGIGMEFTEPKMDDQKSRYIFVANKAGTWSRLVLKSIPHGESIRGRIKGIEPSYFFFDEITEADDPDYYLIPSQSLRRPTGGPKQFGCAGNPPPEGTEHWSWKVMCQTENGLGEDGRAQFKDAVVTGTELQDHLDTPVKAGGRLEGTPENIAVYHVPLSENVYWSREEKRKYQQKLMQEARLDPTAEDRLIKGWWTPRPKGQGLFKEYFAPAIHIKPPNGLARGLGLLPIAGWPIVLGYDLGQVFSSVTILQRIRVKELPYWIAFDELDYLGQRILYKNMARELVRKMVKWRSIPLPSNDGKPYPFNFIHITDESAVNQWRPGGEGSLDAWDFEKVFKQFAIAYGLKPAKLLGCPKPAGSVATRVMMLQNALYDDRFLVSAQCPNVKSMLLNLEAEKDDADKPRRNKWLHKFDSVTYPIYKMDGPGGERVITSSIGSTEGPRLITCGSGN